MGAVACPEITAFSRSATGTATVVLLAGCVGLLSFSGIAGAQETPAPPPVIVPLDVSMEDAGWLGAAAIEEPARDAAPAAAREPAREAEAAAAASRELDKGMMDLLAVPPDFSISALVAASSTPPRTSAAQADAVGQPGRASPATSALQRDRKRHYKVNGSAIEFDIPVQFNGDLAGRVPLRIDSERTVWVQMTGLLAILQDRVDPQVHAWLGSTYSANSHISFDQLRGAGVDVRYDATNDTVVMTLK